MGFDNIEKKSASYHFLKKWVKFWHNYVFYRDVVVLHPENIPKKGHLIFTPNHQNALMDALALLFTTPRIMVFMARSDIFKKKYIASILYFLRILPIYRIRDGYDSLKKNKESFQKTLDVLSGEETALVILPEGSHAGIRRLRPLKKGFARIAFQAEEASGFKLNIRIVPVGIDYSDYESSRSVLTVQFGKPISVSDYYDQYKESPAIAFNLLKNELAGRIKQLIIQIETEIYYDLFDTLRSLYKKRLAERSGILLTNKNSLYIQQSIVRQLDHCLKTNPVFIEQLNKYVRHYLADMHRLKLEDNEEIRKTTVGNVLFSAAVLMVILPLYIYGAINNFLPIFLSLWAKRKVKDPQFKSSFLYVVSMISFPLLGIIQSVVISFFVPHWYWVVLYFISLPLSAIFVKFYYDYFSSFRKKLRLCYLFRKKKELIEQLRNKYHEIIDLMDEHTHPVVKEI